MGISIKWRPLKNWISRTAQRGSIQRRQPSIRVASYPAFGTITNQGFLRFVTKAAHFSGALVSGDLMRCEKMIPA
jgi:hypothetical protein